MARRLARGRELARLSRRRRRREMQFAMYGDEGAALLLLLLLAAAFPRPRAWSTFLEETRKKKIEPDSTQEQNKVATTSRLEREAPRIYIERA